MIRCHLAHLMAEKKMKIAHVAEQTGCNRSTISSLYYENMKKVDIEVIEKLCLFFNCGVGDLFELVEKDD